MSLNKHDNQVNLGHARKRKRIDDKIPKPGGKRPRRCDKESNKQYVSPYFSSTSNNTITRTGRNQHDHIPLQPNTSNNPLVFTRTLSDTSNLSSSTTSSVSSTPKVIKTIQFLAPISLGISQHQSNPTSVW